jgi:hypothetical protein
VRLEKLFFRSAALEQELLKFLDRDGMDIGFTQRID